MTVHLSEQAFDGCLPGCQTLVRQFESQARKSKAHRHPRDWQCSTYYVRAQELQSRMNVDLFDNSSD